MNDKKKVEGKETSLQIMETIEAKKFEALESVQK